MGIQSDAVVKAAKSQLGYREGANNDNRYARDLYPPINHQPWCAVFVSWCFKKANATDLIDVQWNWGFSGCTDALGRFKQKGWQVPKRMARAGDIVFFDFDDRDITSEHVGIVIGRTAGGLVTIEGNTSAEHATGSQANGNGVWKRNRPYGVISGVIRPKYRR